ncbi:SIMPL domain-containing protein [Niveibacterium sp. 24ML]|uniref:SIMPL domain-containing protein n=1 Tax=Niveibacterium sp. 24ML TaxID=2985512 RepID=UPI00226D5FAA|nr:SIMPL domain-containing protein [Niveibacterium sp. 24ML]MCX9156924.1 SIMPL domain-containing protein [Niveibacterium sp. 24ML]
MKQTLIAVLLGASLAMPATAAEAAATVPTIDLSVESARAAANDLQRAVVFIEASDANLNTLTRKVNQAINQGLSVAKGAADVKVRSGNSSTWPNYTRNSQKIDGWRMRSELILESRDSAALSGLLGKLQGELALGQISFSPSPETRRKAEDEAIVDAIAAFKARAELASTALGRKYRIRNFAINTNQNFRPPMPMARAATMSMASEAAPPPSLETGETQISVTVTGTIELQ